MKKYENQQIARNNWVNLVQVIRQFLILKQNLNMQLMDQEFIFYNMQNKQMIQNIQKRNFQAINKDFIMKEMVEIIKSRYSNKDQLIQTGLQIGKMFLKENNNNNINDNKVQAKNKFEVSQNSDNFLEILMDQNFTKSKEQNLSPDYYQKLISSQKQQKRRHITRKISGNSFFRNSFNNLRKSQNKLNQLSVCDLIENISNQKSDLSYNSPNIMSTLDEQRQLYPNYNENGVSFKLEQSQNGCLQNQKQDVQNQLKKQVVNKKSSSFCQKQFINVILGDNFQEDLKKLQELKSDKQDSIDSQTNISSVFDENKKQQQNQNDNNLINNNEKQEYNIFSKQIIRDISLYCNDGEYKNNSMVFSRNKFNNCEKTKSKQKSQQIRKQYGINKGLSINYNKNNIQNLNQKKKKMTLNLGIDLSQNMYESIWVQNKNNKTFSNLNEQKEIKQESKN
ncbi:hypothetical protein PPERSA_02014 [Pseudocohnilembus persalinus]|uniref:Uncharacterized protein n=1 Tax=Pseudocohnilembus persalinus TaxID=266149 RepID=A0A0V0QF61_PSEPJ|nr:hypothetical protein PPERSA_02014 [Pseudocohnilembus persalinus]|eukprot:KRX00835.1 hypothetical protein PPERSA_02014 [Pseudocohnilembus persalinus]